MRWLVTGAAGMLGTDVVDVLSARGEQVTPLVRSDVDLLDEDAVRSAVSGHDVVVNCAAWTAVDDAEANEKQATEVNAGVPVVLTTAAREQGAWLVQVSTDYVFDGHAREPYVEDAPLSPASAYGRGKAAGERAVRAGLPDRHLVLRTAWLYGAHGACFPKTIARLAAERPSLSVVDDQVGQPTWTRDVAELLCRLIDARVPAGTYHATSSGRCSWFDFAQQVVSSAGIDPTVVHPTTSAEFPRPAPRPAFSVLGHDALTGCGVDPIGPWRERWLAAAPSVLAQTAG